MTKSPWQHAHIWKIPLRSLTRKEADWLNFDLTPERTQNDHIGTFLNVEGVWCDFFLIFFLCKLSKYAYIWVCTYVFELWAQYSMKDTLRHVPVIELYTFKDICRMFLKK